MKHLIILFMGLTLITGCYKSEKTAETTDPNKPNPVLEQFVGEWNSVVVIEGEEIKGEVVAKIEQMPDSDKFALVQDSTYIFKVPIMTIEFGEGEEGEAKEIEIKPSETLQEVEKTIRNVIYHKEENTFVFISSIDGMSSEALGVWDPDTSTLTMELKSPDGNITESATYTFEDENTMKWIATVTDHEGVELAKVEGTNTKK